MNAKEDDGTLKPNIESDFEAKYDKLNVVQQKANEEYMQLHSDMVKTIIDLHFEPMRKITVQRENALNNVDAALFQSLLLKMRLSIPEAFWQDDGPRITQMEMLKDPFKNFEGQTWDIKSKTPENRVLPTHNMLENCKMRYLKQQVAAQESIIDELVKKVDEYRAKTHQCTKNFDFILSYAQNAKKNISNVVAIMKEKVTNELRCDEAHAKTPESAEHGNPAVKASANEP